jgi:hypothetical protein
MSFCNKAELRLYYSQAAVCEHHVLSSDILMLRQCGLGVWQNDVISCAQQVELLENQLATRMEQLQATVQSKTAVPTAQVYVSGTRTDEPCW